MKTITALFLAFLLPAIANAAEKSEYLDPFDPAKGFKPAQRDLTEIFLQLAGSLEYYGSPVPYLRHVIEEHKRIEGLYRHKFGKNPTSYRPVYMSDDYIDGLEKNWEFLSPELGLNPFAKDIGNTMRDAIKGTRGTGTILVQIFNVHQTKVFDAMSRKGREHADFDTLRSNLIARLELNRRPPAYEGYEVARRDAISFSLDIQGETNKLYGRVDQALKPADASRIKAYLTSVFMDVGAMAQSELQAGISEWASGKTSTAAK